jgi:hypothetical protein
LNNAISLDDDLYRGRCARHPRADGAACIGQWGRAVNVNGQWLTPQQVAEADRIAGFALPNGYYWWDPQACAWGVVGNSSPVGPAPCGRSAAGGGGRMDPIRPPGPIIAPGPCEGGECVNIPPDLK